ncbi:MAG: site-specific DNA-methyltransferase [Candidatus Lokiarchaeota archaeon]|jgi:site-specific DNA-methyltransferase (adenine-specific)|nr:site-specific DNA-methyltransferase [Candidatus Lokiarchaeota archaeon]
MRSPYFKSQNFTLYHGDSIEILKDLSENEFDMIFADPPYFLSNDGITCKSGQMKSVNKGNWDKSKGFEEDVNFTYEWIKKIRPLLKKDGSIWISGTLHIIYKVGYLLEKNGYDIINDIIWFKPNAPPNLSCRYFTHSHEIILWARKSEKSNHSFNYKLMKHWNNPKDKLKNKDKQMRSVWSIPLLPPSEKTHGRHPTQKPIELLTRIILASTNKGDTVLDPFVGSGTTGLVCSVLNRNFVGIDTNKAYLDLSIKRYKDKNKESLFYFPTSDNKITDFL